MNFVMIATSVFALLTINVVILAFIQNSKNILFSKISIMLGSLIYIISLVFPNQLLFIIGQNFIFIGIVVGVYGLLDSLKFNIPIILFSLTFVLIEILAYLFNIKILMFSYRLSGIPLSTIVSIIPSILLGLASYFIFHKKWRAK